LLLLASDGIAAAGSTVAGETFSDVPAGGSLADFLADSTDAGSDPKATIPVVDTALPSGSSALPGREVVVESAGEAGEGRVWRCVGGVGCIYCSGSDPFFSRVL
jgi:hypothetical protein